MACKITYKGVDYTQNDFMSLLHRGELETLVSEKKLTGKVFTMIPELLNAQPLVEEVQPAATQPAAAEPVAEAPAVITPAARPAPVQPRPATAAPRPTAPTIAPESVDLSKLTMSDRMDAIPPFTYTSQAGGAQLITNALGSEVMITNQAGNISVASLDPIAGQDFEEEAGSVDDAKETLREHLATEEVFNKIYQESVKNNTNPEFVNTVVDIYQKIQKANKVDEIKEAADTAKTVDNVVANQVIDETPSTSGPRLTIDDAVAKFKVGDDVTHKGSPYTVTKVLDNGMVEIFRKTATNRDEKLIVPQSSVFSKISRQGPFSGTPQAKEAQEYFQQKKNLINAATAEEHAYFISNLLISDGIASFNGVDYQVEFAENRPTDSTIVTLYLLNSAGEAKLDKNGKRIKAKRDGKVLRVPASALNESIKSKRLKVSSELKNKSNTKRAVLLSVARKMQEIFVYGPNEVIEFEIVDVDEPWSAVFRGGKVLINERNADINTPIHEFLHPFVAALKLENPELYNSLVASMPNYEDYAKIKKEVMSISHYANSSKEDIDEEIMVRMLTPRIAPMFNEDGSINTTKIREVESKYKGVLSEVVAKIKAYIIEFLGALGINFGERKDNKGIYLEDVLSFEYDISKGILRVFTEGQATVKIKVDDIKTDEGLNIEKALNHISPWVNYTKQNISVALEKIKDNTFNLVAYHNGEIVARNIEVKAILKQDGEKQVLQNLAVTNFNLEQDAIGKGFTPAIFQAISDTIYDAGIYSGRKELINAKSIESLSGVTQSIEEQKMWKNRTFFSPRSYSVSLGMESRETFRKALELLNQKSEEKQKTFENINSRIEELENQDSVIKEKVNEIYSEFDTINKKLSKRGNKTDAEIEQLDKLYKAASELADKTYGLIRSTSTGQKAQWTRTENSELSKLKRLRFNLDDNKVISLTKNDPELQRLYGGLNIFDVSKKETYSGIDLSIDSGFFNTRFMADDTKLLLADAENVKNAKDFQDILDYAENQVGKSESKEEYVSDIIQFIRKIPDASKSISTIADALFRMKYRTNADGSESKIEFTIPEVLEKLQALKPKEIKAEVEYAVKSPDPQNHMIDVGTGFNKSMTLDEIAAVIMYGGQYKFSLGKHKEVFQKMADKYEIREAKELVDFATKLKTQVINLQDLLEKRAVSTGLTGDMKSEAIRMMTTLKPIVEGLVTDDNYRDYTASMIRSGFIALGNAERMMSQIRTKLNYGSVDEYINNLEINLTMAGYTVISKPKNWVGMKIVNGVVELNKDRLRKDGIIPTDISKMVSGKLVDPEKVRKDVQRINTKTINDLRKELTPDEISELNWQIITMRSFYATFKGFTGSLLNQYLDGLDDYEIQEFSNILSRSGNKMKELEVNMTRLASEWLFPYFDDLQKVALQGQSPEVYNKNYKTKEDFSKLLRYANEDNNALDHLFGTIVNSKDPVNASVAMIIQERINRNESILGQVVAEVFENRDSYFVPKNIKDTTQRGQYIKDNYLRKARIKVERRDATGRLVKVANKVQYDYKEFWAFHEEYFEDAFAEARDNYIDSLPVIDRPIGSEISEWDKYNAEVARQKQLIRDWDTTNRNRFLNPKFKTLMNDEMFKFLYESYVSANTRYGSAKLKFGIIPQSYKQEAFIKKQKSRVGAVKEWIETVKKGDRSKVDVIRGSLKGATNYVLSAEDKIYYEQANPDETIYRSIKTKYLRLLEEDVLNFDVTDTIAGFTEDALKYESLRSIQGNIENLRLLINGYAAAGINPRKAPVTDKDGNFIWHSMAKKVKSKNDAEMRLNIQLTQFIDDVFYGDKQKEKTLRLWTSQEYKTNYALAMKMLSEDKTPEEILAATRFYRDESGRWKTDTYQNISVNLNKIARSLSFYTSVNSLAFNVMSTTRNLSIGNFQNLSEAFGNLYYSKRDYMMASKIYFANMPSNSVDLVKNQRRSKLGQILFDFQAIQGEFRNRYNRVTSDSREISEMFTDTVFLLQRAAEHQIQGTATIALMLATKVKTTSGTEISLWDAYEVNSNGILKLRADVDKTSFNQDAFIRKLHEMNRSNHGNYSDLHKTVIQRAWYGSLVMTFRKHLYPVLKARFGKKQVDYSKGRVIQGFHITFFEKLIKDIITHGLHVAQFDIFKKDKTGIWTTSEIYEFNRSVFETLMMFATMIVLTLVLGNDGDDDEDDSVVKKWLLVLLNGLYTDVGLTNPLGIYNPFTNSSEVYKEATKMLDNPIAVQFTYKRIAQFFEELFDGDGDMDSLWNKGEKLIPVLRHIEAVTSPDDYVDNYLKYQSLIQARLDKQREEKEQTEE